MTVCANVYGPSSIVTLYIQQLVNMFFVIDLLRNFAAVLKLTIKNQKDEKHEISNITFYRIFYAWHISDIQSTNTTE